MSQIRRQITVQKAPRLHQLAGKLDLPATGKSLIE
jgi:hypothetical protein